MIQKKILYLNREPYIEKFFNKLLFIKKGISILEIKNRNNLGESLKEMITTINEDIQLQKKRGKLRYYIFTTSDTSMVIRELLLNVLTERLNFRKISK